MATQKIVHLHMKIPITGVNETDFYFGSIKAIFDFVPEDAVGIKYKSLTNALRGRDFYENKHITVRVSSLLTKQQTKERNNDRCNNR